MNLAKYSAFRLAYSKDEMMVFPMAEMWAEQLVGVKVARLA
jgi:hypothetical protein